MNYTALYRKFRPKTFGEMVGQEHITRTLKNQIKANRIGHAYLFNGGRGTGKTSAAKIMARAINCLNPKDGEPCNECEICKGALSGSLTDIVEMDAASNNSVEDIRSIREEVNFLPTVAKYRVYIIDEVHMLSIGAFNALLKTLEEPPEHVKFILATTEPQKLPATILSRCQRFDFKKISNEDIIKRLEIVCKESGIEAEKDALNTIAVLSEGAMRDALSILERCIQDGDTKINNNKIKELVGIPQTYLINKVIKGIIEKNIDETLNTIEEILKDGKDLQNTLWEIIKYVKDILLFKTSGNKGIYSEEEIVQIEEISKNVSKEKLVNLIYNLSELENDMKKSSQKIIIFQAGIIKLCTDVSVDGIEELKNKINNLEKMLKEGNFTQNNNSAVIAQKAENKTKEKPAIRLKPIKGWNDIIENFKTQGKIMLYTNLMNTSLGEVNDLTVAIEFKNGLTQFAKTVLEKPENMQEIEKQVSILKGKEMRVKLIDKNTDLSKLHIDNGIENFAQKNDVNLDVIDE